MQANPVTVLSILQGTKVYQVPIYQRRYSWRSTEWLSLWGDLQFKVAESETMGGARPHFLGNIVVQTIDDPSSTVVKYLVIDGQQRLTTLIVFLAALRDTKVMMRPGWDPAEYDNKYLSNPFDPSEVDRLVPTEFDRAEYVSTIRHGKPAGGIGRAYLYFRRKLRGFTEPQLDLLANTLLRKFLVIFVETDEMDPVNTIFNTLNSKGRPLLPPDLIRNEIFMHLTPAEADRVYYDQWLPLEAALVRSSATGNLQTANFTTFFWSREVPHSPALSKKMLFNAFESRLRKELERRSNDQKEAVVLAEVKSIMEDLQLFKALRDPAAHAATAELGAAVESALLELNEWGSDTHIPIALWVLKSVHQGELSDAEAKDVLRTTFSFMVARSLTGVPTNTLTRILASIPASLTSRGNVSALSALTHELSKPSNRWPSISEASRSVAEYGLTALSAVQQMMFERHVAHWRDRHVEEINDALHAWLVTKPANESEPSEDPESLLTESLFNVLETFTPYEYTTDRELSLALRASLESVRLKIVELEPPLKDLVRTQDDEVPSFLKDAGFQSEGNEFAKAEAAQAPRKCVEAEDLRRRLATGPDQDADESLEQ